VHINKLQMKTFKIDITAANWAIPHLFPGGALPAGGAYFYYYAGGYYCCYGAPFPGYYCGAPFAFYYAAGNFWLL